MKLRIAFMSLALVLLGTGIVFAAGRFSVNTREYDPAKTFMAQAEWLTGIGCPTNARISTNGTTVTASYTDPACAAGDTTDRRNEGLLLAKTGPTGNYAAAVADIKGFSGPVTELGYDLRKPFSAATPNGSHCGAGAPRFDITTTTASYFIGCNSPVAVLAATGNGWIRLRWGGSTPLLGYNATTNVLEAVTGSVTAIQIVFDEGQDTGPDFFGLAVLDNIDINGTLVGRAGDRTGGDGHKGDKKGDKGDDQGDDE